MSARPASRMPCSYREPKVEWRAALTLADWWEIRDLFYGMDPLFLHPVQGRKQQDKVMDVHVLGVQSAEATCGRAGRCNLRLRCPPLSPGGPPLAPQGAPMTRTIRIAWMRGNSREPPCRPLSLDI